MEKKKLLAVVGAIILAGFCSYYLISKPVNNTYEQHETQSDKAEQNVQQDNSIVSKKVKKGDVEKSESAQTVQKAAILLKEESFVTKTDLYDAIPASSLPLSAISILSEQPENIKSTILKIAETNNIYMVQPKKDKLLVIADNPSNIRHGIEFTEVSTVNGQQIKTTLGYNDKMKDTDNDKWEYNDSKQPIRHTKYNKDGDMEFVETWNYDDSKRIKYDMKDANDKVISLRKETLENGTDLRVEHLLYDKDGRTRINVSATYEGEDIKRFTYYNADKPNESGSIFSDYSNGLKTKETVYTSDLKVKNSYTSEYKDDSRTDIIKWDNKNQEVHKYLPEEETF